MQVTINTSRPLAIDWSATGQAEIIQNVFTLVTTQTYEVAYDRTLGIPGSYSDLPAPEAVPLIISRIYDLIETREPRATVVDVIYNGASQDGELIFEVVIDV